MYREDSEVGLQNHFRYGKAQLEARPIGEHAQWNRNHWPYRRENNIASISASYDRAESGFMYKKKKKSKFHQQYSNRIHQRQDNHQIKTRSTNSDICMNCSEVFKDFCQQTSLHGLKFAGDTTTSWLQRLFWVVTFILAVLAASYYIHQVYMKWKLSPVIVSIGAKITPMIEVPFPAITICTMNEARRSNAEKIMNSTGKEGQQMKKLLKEYCNKEMENDNKENVKPQKRKPADWPTLLKYMTTVRQPCHEMILSCFYAGSQVDCTDIFNPTLSDEGICCAFNNVKRDFLYRNPRDLSDLNVTFPLPCVDWTPENGFPAGTTNISVPWRPRGPGSHLGLTVVLDIEDEEFFCSTSASKGLKMLLHSPVEAPKIADYGSLITGGTEYRIRISPKIMNSSESLHDIKEVDRQCVFSSEKELQFYRTYTQRNCLLECEANYTLEACFCVPYYMPKNADTPICGRESENCTQEAKEVLDMVIVDRDISFEGKPTPNCHCPRGCSELSYTSTMTYGSVETRFAAKRFNQPEGNRKDSLAIVHLFFTETEFLNYHKSELIGFSDFLSSTGGLLGLFLGFSFISAVEIVYFSTVRFGIKLFEARHNNIGHAPLATIKKRRAFLQMQ